MTITHKRLKETSAILPKAVFSFVRKSGAFFSLFPFSGHSSSF
jgi:hypothetical protein